MFDWYGRTHREMVLDLLPRDWAFQGKRILDFGCGPGALMRYFVDEAAVASSYACDIHEPSIAWLQQHLSPPFNVSVNSPVPPLPLPDGHFDLVLALEVLTVMADHWSDWLVELHRLLDPNGVIIATVAGARMAEAISGHPWDDARTGMNVFGHGEWSPTVIHSPWWISSHWGRIFSVNLDRGECPCGHDVVLLRKKRRICTPAELEEPDPLEPREAMAMSEQLRQFRHELMDGFEQRQVLRAQIQELGSGAAPPCLARPGP